MIVALDWDDCAENDRDTFRDIVRTFIDNDASVCLVTSRPPGNHPVLEEFSVTENIPVFYASNHSKRKSLKMKGLTPDVWIVGDASNEKEM